MVEVENLEKNDTMALSADDDICNKLVNFINLDEFNVGASASGSKRVVYMFDKPLDGLDFNLGTFNVDSQELEAFILTSLLNKNVVIMLWWPVYM